MAKVASGPAPLCVTFNPDNYVTNYLDRETVLKLHDVFLTFDYDGSGKVTVQEMINTIKALNIQSQMQQIMDAIHRSGVCGDMDFQMFVKVFGTDACSTTSNNLQTVFRAFDERNQGFFGPTEFQKLSNSMGLDLSDQQILEMVMYADLDQDGVINFEQFLSVMTKSYSKV